MSIDQEKFMEWAEERFDGDIKFDTKGSIRLNSIFTDDYKHHMYCHCDPQVKDGSERPYGTFHCFKTDQVGSLITLVMKVDECPYDEAMATLGGENHDIRNLEERLQQMLKDKRDKIVERALPEDQGLQLPDASLPICELPEENYYRVSAELYLMDRKLNASDYWVCINGEYKNRIIIPYYDREMTLIYWNSRIIGDPKDKDVLRYRGPDADVGIGKSDVVYMSHWPKLGSRVHLTEGEFDADSLSMCGLHGGALGGKNFGPDQARYLRGYWPVMALDNDSAGQGGIIAVGQEMLRQGLSTLHFVRPPKGYKDWNKMLVDLGPEIVRAYIAKNEKPFNDLAALEEELSHFKVQKKNFRPSKPID